MFGSVCLSWERLNFQQVFASSIMVELSIASVDLFKKVQINSHQHQASSDFPKGRIIGNYSILKFRRKSSIWVPCKSTAAPWSFSVDSRVAQKMMFMSTTLGQMMVHSNRLKNSRHLTSSCKTVSSSKFQETSSNWSLMDIHTCISSTRTPCLSRPFQRSDWD